MKTLSLTPSLAIKLLMRTANAWIEDNAMRLAAALSYYSVFSIAPLLLIAIGIAGLVFTKEAAQGEISKQLTQFIGPQAAEAMQAMVSSASASGGGATAVGLVVLFFGASSVFGQLKEALNTVWGVKPKPGLGISGFVKERLMSFGMVLAIGFLLLTSLVLTTALSATSDYLERSLHLPKFVSGLVGFVLAFGVETLLFSMLFKVLPDAKVRWKNVWTGAIVTALLFEIGKMGLSWYLGQKSTTSPFGAAGSLVVLLLWVFYASCILFFGAEFTKIYSAEAGEEIRPGKLAVRVPSESELASGTRPKVPSQAHPLNPEQEVPIVPMRESLAPLLNTPHVASDALRQIRLHRPELAARKAPPRNQWEAFLQKAHENPVAELGAALGVGLLFGTLSRFTEKAAPTLTAAEHFEQGTRKSAIATRTVVLAGAGWVSRHVIARAVKRFNR